jgi:uncharacterized protein
LSTLFEAFSLVIVGGLTGFIDSIAGGGGFISLPFLAGLLDDFPQAIGTNKIVGTTGAFVAFLVYRKCQVERIAWPIVIFFLSGIFLGTITGATLSPYLPQLFFKTLLLMAAPFFLWAIWNKKLWQKRQVGAKEVSRISAFLCGLAVGFYDGGFGPGGGTLMLMALLFILHLPVVMALFLSKLANTLSAGASLLTYASQGVVHWKIGSLMAFGMMIGAFIGSYFAGKHLEKIIRPIMTLVVILLLIRLFRG